jgi:hypothetical protein
MSLFGSRNVGFFGGASGTAPVGLVGSGNTPYLAKWTSSSSISNSSVYDDSSNTLPNKYFDITQSSKNALRLNYYENIYILGLQSIKSGMQLEDNVNIFGSNGATSLNLDTSTNIIDTYYLGGQNGLIINPTQSLFGSFINSFSILIDDANVTIQTTYQSVGNGLFVNNGTSICQFGNYSNSYNSNYIQLDNLNNKFSTYYNNDVFGLGVFYEPFGAGSSISYLGDFDLLFNQTLLSVFNTVNLTDEYIVTSTSIGLYGVYVIANETYRFGDFDLTSGSDGVYCLIDDTSQGVTFYGKNIYMDDDTSGNLISNSVGTYGGDNLILTIDNTQYLIKLNT